MNEPAQKFTDGDRARLAALHGDGPHYGPATRALAYIAELESALRLIAAQPRPDGTYNRSREACEELARAVLAKEASDD